MSRRWNVAPVAAWTDEIGRVAERIGRYFAPAEPRRRAAACLRGGGYRAPRNRHAARRVNSWRKSQRVLAQTAERRAKPAMEMHPGRSAESLPGAPNRASSAGNGAISGPAKWDIHVYDWCFSRLGPFSLHGRPHRQGPAVRILNKH